MCPKCKQEIEMVLLEAMQEVKQRHDFFLSPSEGMEFSIDFGTTLLIKIEKLIKK